MSIEVFSPELDYDTRVLNASTSIYRTIVPQASSTPSISQNSSVGPVEFVIPASVFNPKKSRLNFTLSAPSAGASPTFSWVNANALTMINRIVLYDVSTNAVWLDCSQFNSYASLTSTSGTCQSEFFSKGGSGSATPSAGNPAEDIMKSNSTNNYTVNMSGTVLDVGALNSYMGRRQKFISADNTAFTYDFSIPFSAFKHTALAMDKQIYNPSNMILQVYFNGTDSYAFTSISATAVTTVTSIPVGASLSNLSISLCNEGNLEVVGQVIETVMKSGISIPIGYPTTTRQSIASSASQAYQVQLTRGYGQRILAIISAPFSTAVGGGSGIATANIHGRGNITFFNTFINNVALKFPNGYDCTKSADYYIGNKEQLVGSALQNLAEYISCEWLHSDSFVGDKPLCHLDTSIISGLDVSNQSSTWQIQANLSANTAYTWITAIIGQKVLTLSNSGSVVV
jgi:hypothetical protein